MKSSMNVNLQLCFAKCYEQIEALRKRHKSVFREIKYRPGLLDEMNKLTCSPRAGAIIRVLIYVTEVRQYHGLILCFQPHTT
jgi:hypothetical protein